MRDRRIIGAVVAAAMIGSAGGALLAARDQAEAQHERQRQQVAATPEAKASDRRARLLADYEARAEASRLAALDAARAEYDERARDLARARRAKIGPIPDGEWKHTNRDGTWTFPSERARQAFIRSQQQPLARMKAEVDRIERLKGRWVIGFGGWADVRVGSAGVLGAARVDTVIDGENLLIEFGPGRCLWVTGLSTHDLADGSIVRVNRVCSVTGTRKYLGTTYFVVEVLSDEEVEVPVTGGT